MIKSRNAKIGDWIFVVICVLVSIICLVPMVNLLARSLSGTEYLIRREVYLIPKGINFDAYMTVLGDAKYIKSFFFTVFLTVVCTLVSLAMTTLCAYPLIFSNGFFANFSYTFDILAIPKTSFNYSRLSVK